jgi:hypothetical protein
MSAELREHLRKRHSRVHIPRSNVAVERLHALEHHRYVCNHDHAGPNLGPSQRPEGWRTGGDVIEKRP